MEWLALLPILFFGMFLLVAGVILFQIARGVGRWAENNSQPVLTETARVVAKCTDTTGHDAGVGVTTWYYATFELPSGERCEMGLSGKDFGSLAEGDEGVLTYQGTRYKGFARQSMAASGQRSAA
jgi:hypothetical protein